MSHSRDRMKAGNAVFAPFCPRISPSDSLGQRPPPPGARLLTRAFPAFLSTNVGIPDTLLQPLRVANEWCELFPQTLRISISVSDSTASMWMGSGFTLGPPCPTSPEQGGHKHPPVSLYVHVVDAPGADAVGGTHQQVPSQTCCSSRRAGHPQRGPV